MVVKPKKTKIIWLVFEDEIANEWKREKELGRQREK